MRLGNLLRIFLPLHFVFYLPTVYFFPHPLELGLPNPSPNPNSTPTYNMLFSIFSPLYHVVYILYRIDIDLAYRYVHVRDYFSVRVRYSQRGVF